MILIDSPLQRAIATLIFTAVLLVALALPAAAHNLTVSPPGAAEPHHGWVGALALPGKGAGLVPGGPTGDWMLSPAHAKGLIIACEMNGSDVVDIRGPGGPGCAHGE